MTLELEAVLSAYGAAWSEPDEAKRLALLEASWSAKGCYTDPQSAVEGRAGLSALIGGFHAQMPGARIELTSGVSAHHGRIHFTWRLVQADGTVAVDGVDFGTLDADGRLLEIVGFFGPPPPL